MSVQRIGEARRGRPSKSEKIIADLYKEGKCRECSVNVTRMDFAKILGKFTKVKIQYESSPRPNKIEKKITSPTSASRLRSNENGMVLIHRSVYKEHPAKTAPLTDVDTAPAQTPRKRGRPPKNIAKPSTLTRYRIIFCERRKSLEACDTPEDTSIVDILPALTADILPTDEWLVDYLLQDEPTNDRVYDRIAAQLEDLMYDAKPDPPPSQSTTENKTDDFPSIMELLSDTTGPQLETAESQTDTAKLENDINMPTTDSKHDDATKMDVDQIAEDSSVPESKQESDGDKNQTPSLDENTSIPDETPKVNGNMARVGDRNVDVQSINCIVFKRVKNDECNRMVKCSKKLDYSIEIDGRLVQLAGAPKYISCVDDLRLMLQIVHESDLSSFYVVEQR